MDNSTYFNSYQNAVQSVQGKQAPAIGGGFNASKFTGALDTAGTIAQNNQAPAGESGKKDLLSGIPIVGAFYKAGTSISRGITAKDPESEKKGALAGFTSPSDTAQEAFKREGGGAGAAVASFLLPGWGGAQNAKARKKKRQERDADIKRDKLSSSISSNSAQSALTRNLTPKFEALPFGG